MTTFRQYLAGLLMLGLLAGCSGPLYEYHPTITARVTPRGIQAQVRGRPAQFRPKGRMPEVQQEFGNGWYTPGQDIYLSTRDKWTKFHLQCHGRTTSAVVNYDDVKMQQTDDNNWDFWLKNTGDDGLHPMWVEVHYNNWGLPPELWATPDSLPFIVHNVPLNQR